MSRLFDDASTQYLSVDSVGVSAEPLSMACWFYSDDTTLTQVLVNVNDKDVATFGRYVAAGGNITGDPVRAGSGGTGNAHTTTGYSANTWHHAAAVFSATDARAAYIDGGSKGTNANSITTTDFDRTSIGRMGDSSPSNYTSGRIAEVGIWNIALSDADVADLAQGICPLFVRQDGLVAYFPLWGVHSPEIDPVGKFDLTVTGATKAEHPRIIVPNRSQLWVPPAAAPGGGTLLPKLMQYGLYAGRAA